MHRKKIAAALAVATATSLVLVPQAQASTFATRFSASEEFLANTTSRDCGAPMNAATLARAPSRAAVASSAMR